MKKLIHSISVLLVLSLLTQAAWAQSSPSHPGSKALPGSNIKIPELVNQVKIPEAAKAGGAAVQVSPNPCNGAFTVRFYSSNSGKVSITVSDSEGGGMMAVDAVAIIGINSIPINIKSYGPGTYTVTVSGAGVYGTIPVVFSSH